jgi:excinuclease UvrABC nuclease subunit
MIYELFENCLDIDCSVQEPDTAQVLSALPTAKGLLLFADSDDRPIQLLIAANIRRTARARLLPEETDTPTKRTHISDIAKKIYALPCYCDFRSLLAHYRIAKKLFPDTWQDMANYGNQSYVKIDLSANWPFFATAARPATAANTKTFGPFPSRRSAAEFIKILHSVFALCQMPELVADPERSKSCPYLQMKTCPAPCIGGISKEQYLNQIHQAVGATTGNLATHLDKLKADMKHHSENTQFEQANTAKTRIEQLSILKKMTYRWTTDLAKLAILHIDRSAKIKQKGKRKLTRTYAAFLIKAGHIIELKDFTVEDIEKFHQSLVDHLDQPPEQIPPQQICEELALTTSLLYRNKPAGLWLNLSQRSPRSTPPSPAQIAAAIDRLENHN